MKKITLFFLFIGNIVDAQKMYDGWILDNNNDTMKCKIFSPNGLHKRLTKRHESYFHDCIYILTNQHKERKIKPDEIKEYYFEYGDSTNKTKFHAATFPISHNKGVAIKNKYAGYYNVFVRKLVTNGYYHLFYYDEIDFDGSIDKNFILYNPVDSSSRFFSRTRQLMNILDWPAESERNNERYKDWFKGKQNVVFDYNNYKATLKN